MAGMMVPLFLASNMERFWSKRLIGKEAFRKWGYSVHQMFKGLEKLTFRKKGEEWQVSQANQYSVYDDQPSPKDLLPAFGFTEKNVKDYAQRILDTPGYFHEQEDKIREDDGVSYW